jgi:aromatase
VEPFEFDVSFDVGLQRVLDAFWELEDWPSVASHVREIEMHYADENVQVLTMHVVTIGRHDRFKSLRMKQGTAIYYLQPNPPPILLRHNGSWQFKVERSGTVVTSRHFIDVNIEAANAFLREIGAEVTDDRSTQQQIKALIRNNSLQTMLALKKRLEHTNGETHVSQTVAANAMA